MRILSESERIILFSLNAVYICLCANSIAKYDYMMRPRTINDFDFFDRFSYDSY